MKEFQDFMASDVKPPRALDAQVQARIQGLLNPTGRVVFGKLLAIHLVTGSLMLMVCPQLGLGNDVLGLMRLFMAFGMVGCMLGCGAFFLGSSAIVASLVLRPEELQVVRKRSFVHFSMLALLSLVTLMIFGANAASALGLYWTAGSIVGGVLTLEMVWRLRLSMGSARA